MQFEELTYKIIGMCFRIHNALGAGFPEKVYHRALKIELELSKVDFVSEKSIPIYYREKLISRRRVDFLIEGRVMLELKDMGKLSQGALVQTLNYIESGNLAIALLVNFGAMDLEFKRVFNKKYKSKNYSNFHMFLTL